jgi:hypothetical protein
MKKCISLSTGRKTNFREDNFLKVFWIRFTLHSLKKVRILLIVIGR